jgi:hypothetical protein
VRYAFLLRSCGVLALSFQLLLAMMAGSCWGVNEPPRIRQHLSVSTNYANPGKSAELSIGGSDDGGDQNLTYRWSVAYTKNGIVIPVTAFSLTETYDPTSTTIIQGTNAAKHCFVFFPEAATYTISCTITDTGGLSVSEAKPGGYVLQQVATSLTVTPATATITVGDTLQYSAVLRDQFGSPMPIDRELRFSSTLGSFDGNGVFTPTGIGTAPVSARIIAGGTPTGTATVTVTGVAISTPTTIGAGVTTYDNKDVLITGTTVTIIGQHTFGSLSVRFASVLTAPGWTPAGVTPVTVTCVRSLSIDVTSSVDVTGKGYAPGYTVGNTTVGGANGASGGSYGGYGHAYSGATNQVYGQFTNPNDCGSGSGSYAGGSSGGGLIRLKAAKLVHAGKILANGANATYPGAGGGSGGGIFIDTDVLASTAGSRLEAKGGIDAYASGLIVPTAGCGGGGRIALYYRSLQSGSALPIRYANSPSASTTQTVDCGGAGTIFVQQLGAVYGSLVIDNGGLPNWLETPVYFGDRTLAASDPATGVKCPYDFTITSANGGTWSLQGARAVFDATNSGLTTFERTDLAAKYGAATTPSPRSTGSPGWIPRTTPPVITLTAPANAVAIP